MIQTSAVFSLCKITLATQQLFRVLASSLGMLHMLSVTLCWHLPIFIAVLHMTWLLQWRQTHADRILPGLLPLPHTVSTGGGQALEVGKAWEQGYTVAPSASRVATSKACGHIFDLSTQGSRWC